MIKELEALKKIGNLHSITKGCAINNTDEYKVIEQALQRLEAIEKGKNTDIIDNYMAFKNSEQTEPSEALDYLVDISIFSKDYDEFGNYKFQKDYEHIKQALLKAEKLEKALNIIKEKKVDMFNLKVAIDNNSLRLYNNTISKAFKHLKLTEQEFELLRSLL